MRLASLIFLLALMSACSTVKNETRKAGRTAARIGNTVEEGAQTAGRKTQSFFQRLFGSDKEPARRSSRSTSSRPESSDEAEFDTYAPQYVGSEN